MIHTTKTSLARELKLHRLTINNMIDRGEIKVVYNNLNKKHYIHILKGIKELLTDM